MFYVQNGHKWSYTDFIIKFPLHCNACEMFLLTSTGKYLYFKNISTSPLTSPCRSVLLSLRSGGLHCGQVYQDGGQEGLLQDGLAV